MTRNRRSVLCKVMLRSAVVLFLALSLGACTKKTGVAIVVEKEHIDAADAYPSVTPSPTIADKRTATPSGSEPEYTERELAADEVVVDSFVMKKEARGTKKDPRATTIEQWRVKVRMVDGGRQFVVLTDRARYEKIKAGDRIKVRYKEGNYTGTVWDSEIVD